MLCLVGIVPNIGGQTCGIPPERSWGFGAGNAVCALDASQPLDVPFCKPDFQPHQLCILMSW